MDGAARANAGGAEEIRSRHSPKAYHVLELGEERDQSAIAARTICGVYLSSRKRRDFTAVPLNATSVGS